MKAWCYTIKLVFFAAGDAAVNCINIVTLRKKNDN
jgi:hypothetical protein